VKKEDKEMPTSPQEQEGSYLRNIGKVILLIAGLVAAWFILERLIGSN
jgi:hypothetical protein